MKAKLTVTIDSRLIPRAKAHARAQGKSLSQVIEDALREVSDGGPGSRKPFSEVWRGRLRPARKDDDRYRRLAGKYL